VFRPLVELTPAERADLVTLPPTIARLTRVKHFVLYGSLLVRIPPEIGSMASLEVFEPYTSYSLHWYTVRADEVCESARQHGEHASPVRELQVPAGIPETATRRCPDVGAGSR